MTAKEKAEDMWLYYDQWPNLNHNDIRAMILNTIDEVLGALEITIGHLTTSDNDWQEYLSDKKYWNDVKKLISKA